MTICVALRAPEGVFIGSDTLSVNGSTKEHCGQKWAQCGKWWIGVAGALRALNLIQVNAAGIARSEHVAEVVDTIHLMLVNDKWKPIEEEGRPPRFQFEAIITDGAKIWGIGANFGFLEHTAVAIGSGTDAALGAHYAACADVSDRENLAGLMIAAAIFVEHNCGGEPWTKLIKPERKEPANVD